MKKELKITKGTSVRAKKHLGQHFLNDLEIASQIVNSLESFGGYNKVLEIGPGMGVLTQFLLKKEHFKTYVIEKDAESVVYLHQHFTLTEEQVVFGDFLALNLSELFHQSEFAIIGNFPYNISTPIIFKILENKELVPEMVGMFQKEVGERITAKEGSKIYGIPSVLVQAFYNVTYLFTVNEDVFTPPPKVKSCVIRLQRKSNADIGCNVKQFKTVVKMGFGQRRKTLRNSLKSILPDEIRGQEIFNKRPEQLSVEEFVGLTNLIYPKP